MEKFTKEQLIEAQTLFNQNWAANPDDFKSIDFAKENPRQAVEEQIDYLLSLIPAE